MNEAELKTVEDVVDTTYKQLEVLRDKDYSGDIGYAIESAARMAVHEMAKHKDAHLARQDALLEEAKKAVQSLRGYCAMEEDFTGVEQCEELINAITSSNHSEGETS